MSTNYEITQEGLDKLKAEYNEIVNVRLKEIALKIKEAKDFGDLSENAEYDEAKKELAEVDARKHKLEKFIENAVVIDVANVNIKTVSLGVTVTLYDYEYQEEVSYKIVGETESDPMNGLISSTSPVGSALIGKKKGQEIEVHIPDGIAKYKILKIAKK